MLGCLPRHLLSHTIAAPPACAYRAAPRVVLLPICSLKLRYYTLVLPSRGMGRRKWFELDEEEEKEEKGEEEEEVEEKGAEVGEFQEEEVEGRKEKVKEEEEEEEKEKEVDRGAEEEVRDGDGERREEAPHEPERKEEEEDCNGGDFGAEGNRKRTRKRRRKGKGGGGSGSGGVGICGGKEKQGGGSGGGATKEGGGGGGGSGGFGGVADTMVEGEANARMNPRKGEVAVFPLIDLWPSCRTTTPGTAEHRHFRHAAAQVASGGGGHEQNIKYVEYAVNPGLEEAYYTKKEEMTRRLGSAGVDERLLFHGTSFASSEAILRENFRLDKVGAEGGVGARAHTRIICLFPISLFAQFPVRTWPTSTTGDKANARDLRLHTDAFLSHGTLSRGPERKPGVFVLTRKGLSPKQTHHTCTSSQAGLTGGCLGPFFQVGSATDGGWFGRGFYFSPWCDVSRTYARRGGSESILIVKVLVGGVKTFYVSLC
jgi:hypothetical protein